MSLSKTISMADFQEPTFRRAASLLKGCALRLFLRGTPFAVNGVAKHRLRIRWNKLWEYSRALAHVPWQPDWKVADFGGGATLPVYFLASKGCEVSSFDIDPHLTGLAHKAAAKHRWPLHASTRDLTVDPMQAEEQFSWVVSFCVLEHLPREKQLAVAKTLASYLKRGGYMTITFDYGEHAPVGGALHTMEDVQNLMDATGLQLQDGSPFSDTGERFELDRKYPGSLFTFGSLFLRKP
jgi:hypothetical protein